MSDGFVNGEVLDSPTVNAFVVGVEVVPPSPPPPSALPAERPTITGFSPAVGLADQQFTLRITGTGFTEAVEVLAGGRPAKGTTYVSATEVTSDVDATGIAVGTKIPVSVRDVSGESKAIDYPFGEGVPPGGAPVITSLDPTEKGWGAAAPPFTLHIYGDGFTAAAVVWFDGAAVNTGYVSAGQVDTEVDRSGYTADKSVPVWVVDAAGQSNTATFEFVGEWWPGEIEAT